MSRKLDTLAFASSAAVVAALIMVMLGIAGYLGVYTGAVEAMETWHMFFSVTAVGTVTGAVEAAVWTFVFCVPFVAMYNRLVGEIPEIGGSDRAEGVEGA